MENKKKFFKFTGKNVTYKKKDGSSVVVPFVIAEGYIAQVDEIKVAKNGEAYLRLRLANNHNPERLYDYLTGSVKNKEDYTQQDSYFITLTAFSRVAVRLEKIAEKGKRMVVWGEFQKNEYEKKDGTKGVDYVINVEDFIPLTFKKTEDNQEIVEETDFEEIQGEEIPF